MAQANVCQVVQGEVTPIDSVVTTATTIWSMVKATQKGVVNSQSMAGYSAEWMDLFTRTKVRL